MLSKLGPEYEQLNHLSFTDNIVLITNSAHELNEVLHELNAWNKDGA